MNNNLRNPYKMYKKAGTVSDTLTDMAWSAVPIVSDVNGPVKLMSIFTAPDDIKSVKEYNATAAGGLVPTVGGIRNNARRKAITKHLTKGKNSKRSLVAESFGGLPLLLAATGGGALLGYLLGDDPRAKASLAMLGGGIGAAGVAGAHLIGALASAVTPTRTTKEQEAYEKGPMWKNWVIPGASTYNYWKALGYAIDQEKPGGIFAPDAKMLKNKPGIFDNLIK